MFFSVNVRTLTFNITLKATNLQNNCEVLSKFIYCNLDFVRWGEFMKKDIENKYISTLIVTFYCSRIQKNCLNPPFKG